MTKAAYIDITPTVNFQVRGKDASSATVVRQLFIDGNDSDRDQIITDLYGAVDTGLRDMFKQRLGVTDNVVRMMQECRRIGTARSLALMERIIRAERAVLREFALDDTDQDPDYIDEKWSKKYKSSINCANPRGFSQRAHCAGRKK